MVRAAVVVAAFLCFAGCDQRSDAQQRLIADQAIYARMDRLQARIAVLEAKVDAEQKAQDAAGAPSMPAPRPAAGAVLIGSTSRGEAINQDFSSLAACQSARNALVAEADRICEQRRGVPGTVYVDCLYPQVACSRR